jgi:chromosome segregation ATPase
LHNLQAQVSESLYSEEVKQRKETQEALAKEKEEIQKVKTQLNQVMEELQNALEKQSSLESQITESDEMVKGLELRMASAMELLQTYKKERDEFEAERDNAQKKAEELRRKQEEASSTKTPQFFSELFFSYIE